MQWIEFPKQSERKDPLAQVVFWTAVHLIRNIEGLRFPEQSPLEERMLIESQIKETFQVIYPDAIVKTLDDLNDEQRHTALSSHIFSKDFLTKGRMFIYDPYAAWVVALNDRDHYRIHSMETGVQLNKLYRNVNGVTRTLQSKAHFAFDEKWGYLTSSVLDMGTGMRMEALLNLYGMLALSQMTDLAKGLKDMGYRIRSIGRSKQHSGLYVLDNLYSMGSGEQDMLDEFKSVLKRLVIQEEQARTDAFVQNAISEELFTRLFNYKARAAIEWHEMLELIALVDAMHSKLVYIPNISEWRLHVSRLTDDNMLYQHHVDVDEIANVRMQLLRSDLSKLKYQNLAPY